MLPCVNTEDDSTAAAVTLPVSVRDLLPQDLPACTWSGSDTHLRHVERELARAAAGEVDYLAVCTPADMPVAKGGIDYQVSGGAGTLWQLAVMPALQSCGLGTLLVRAAEQRIRDRGLRRAELAVEESIPGRARPHHRRPAAADSGDPQQHAWVLDREAWCPQLRRPKAAAELAGQAHRSVGNGHGSRGSSDLRRPAGTRTRNGGRTASQRRKACSTSMAAAPV